jgi:hypothetical protein
MSVLRVNKKKDNYSVIDNTSLRDKKLSWKAKGMIAYLLSLPDDWQIFVSELTTHSKDGRDGTTAAIKELMDNGYIVRTDGKDEKGRFCYNYEVFEVPSPKPLPTLAPPPSNPLGENRNGKAVTVNPKREDRNGESVATNGTLVPCTNEVNTNEVNTNEDSPSPTVEAPDEKENSLNDLQTESKQDTPLRPATSFETQTKPKEAKTEGAIKALKAGDRSKHLHQYFIDAFSNTYKTLSDGAAFLWQGKELIAIKKVREEITNLLYTKYETVSDEKIKESFADFMASALKDKWMKDNFAPSMLYSKFSAVIILVKKHSNGSRPSAMPVYTAKTVAFTSFT